MPPAAFLKVSPMKKPSEPCIFWQKWKAFRSNPLWCGFCWLVKLVRAGQIKPNDVVVINCTGHTTPIERNILGEGWAKDLVLPSKSMEESNEEGLLAALSKVGIDRFPRIAIVDDTPDARRLIRRILQSQGNFTIFEASNGKEALEMIRQRTAQPDHSRLDDA